MITNERQHKITKNQIAKIKLALSNFDIQLKAEQIGSKRLAKAEFEALKSELENLEHELYEYEKLKSGTDIELRALSMSDLPKILIQSRIAQNLTQRDLAELVGIKEQQIQRYESEEYSSASLRRLLEIAEVLKISVSELSKVDITSKSIQNEEEQIIDWSKFPVKEMYRRGWFADENYSYDFIKNEGTQLVFDYINNIIKRPLTSLHRIRIRAGSDVDKYSLLAWESRILSLASNEKVINEYRKELITPEWINNLVKESRFGDGPLRAQTKLKEIGIKLIIEPHLANTYLDGAALLFNETPIIGMSIRYDRLDNFWFVLLHELMHIINHLQKSKIETIFDDLDANDNEKNEQEADILAREALIPTMEWNNSFVRFLRSSESICDFAEKLNIHPAIVAGRIRYESNNFVILNDLIGQGEVRKLFSNVKFGI